MQPIPVCGVDVGQYWQWLIAISLFVALLERLSPWRPEQGTARRGLIQDLFYLALNGHGLSLLVAMVAVEVPLPRTDWAQSWPAAVQFLVMLVGLDLLQWCIHNLLHRVPFLWQFHKLHHSSVELDWAGNFRFHWVEALLYRAIQYVPLGLMGFSPEVMMLHAVVGTLIGHLNHANLDWDYGPLRYVLNNPRMHIWHHARDEVPSHGVNFGVILCCWDWLFGTAWLPAERGRAPARLGFEDLHQYPEGLLGQLVYPIGASPSPQGSEPSAQKRM